MASSVYGCKKKIESSGKVQIPQALSSDQLSEEAAEEIDGEQPLTDPDRIL